MPRGFFNSHRFWKYLGIQILLWLFHYLLLACLTHLTALTINPELYSQVGLRASLIVALLLGFFNGITTGIIHQVLDKKYFHNKTLWVVILLKAGLSMIVFVVLISLVRYSIYPILVDKMFGRVDHIPRDAQWDYLFYLLLIFDVFAGIVINFFNLVHNKYGPGVLMPLLLGKYRSPKEEERIFLFMDLKSSTAIAEQLGHIRYSAFIRDSFMDINELLTAYNARVYQYVGDEIVLTWTAEDGLRGMACFEFFFACQERFRQRAAHYIHHYGHLPQFKAGMNMGIVTAVEVGHIKKDIAYHGDTLNTASRIQSICNDYGKSFLVSEKMLPPLDGHAHKYRIEQLGSMLFKGKSRPVGIASLELAEPAAKIDGRSAEAMHKAKPVAAVAINRDQHSGA